MKNENKTSVFMKALLVIAIIVGLSESFLLIYKIFVYDKKVCNVVTKDNNVDVNNIEFNNGTKISGEETDDNDK